MRYLIQIHNHLEWVTVQEVISEELAYWIVANKQREGTRARVLEVSRI